MAASILIIGPAGRLRDGLCTMLRSFTGVTRVITADDFESGIVLAASWQPNLVIIDGVSYRNDDCRLLRTVLSQLGHCPCLVIANTLQQKTKANQMGANAILLSGFTTETLRQTLLSLDVLSESDVLGEPAVLSPTPKASGPLQPKR